MENYENKSPKDDRITNDDNSVTNKDELEKGNQPTKQDKPDEERVPTVTPDNNSGDPGPAADEDSSNKGKGPAGENL